MVPSMFCQYGKLSGVHVDNSVVNKKLDKLRQGPREPMTFNHARYLKEIAEDVCHALTIILRKSLVQGEIPDDWRMPMSTSAQFSHLRCYRYSIPAQAVPPTVILSSHQSHAINLV